MRLIDADELRKYAIPCEFHNGALTDLCVPLYQINNAPTVEIPKTIQQAINFGIFHAENQRQKGDWIGNYDNLSQSFYWICDKCNYMQSWGRFKYCPNCGADMRGEK